MIACICSKSTYTINIMTFVWERDDHGQVKTFFLGIKKPYIIYVKIVPTYFLGLKNVCLLRTFGELANTPSM